MKPLAGTPTPLHREDWNTRRFKFLFSKISRPTIESDGVVTAFRDGTVTLRSKRREDGFTFADKEIGYQGVEPGDLVIHAMDGFAGAIGVSDSRGKCSPVLSVLEKLNGVEADARFWAYYYRNLATTGFIESLAKGIRERSTDFRWKDAGNLLVNFPDQETQKSIADLLDRETARIDALIEKKFELIEIIKEKRHSVISQVVTKGLNSAVVTKSSNVNLVGEIPEHWSITKLIRQALRIGDGLHGTPIYDDDGEFYFVNGTNLFNGKIRITEKTRFVSSIEVEKHSVPLSNSTLLISINGTIGNIAPYKGERIILGKSAAYINLINTLYRDFMFFYLQSSAVKNFFNLSVTGSTISNLSLETLRNTPICMPPIAEQIEISAYLRRVTGKLDSLEQKIRETVSSLKEYRTSLITAAVTGQIDVFEYHKTGTTDQILNTIEEELA